MRKTLGYRLRYSLAHLNGGTNGKKTITGAGFYILANFINEHSLSLGFNFYPVTGLLRGLDWVLHLVLYPAFYIFGSILMIVGLTHKVIKFLFPKLLCGL